MDGLLLKDLQTGQTMLGLDIVDAEQMAFSGEDVVVAGGKGQSGYRDMVVEMLQLEHVCSRVAVVEPTHSHTSLVKTTLGLIRSTGPNGVSVLGVVHRRCRYGPESG
ncbi:hypothetical protein LTR53_018370, partial [Teratosphaeriaceae sp. CCFEE 6253]